MEFDAFWPVCFWRETIGVRVVPKPESGFPGGALENIVSPVPWLMTIELTGWTSACSMKTCIIVEPPAPTRHGSNDKHKESRGHLGRDRNGFLAIRSVNPHLDY